MARIPISLATGKLKDPDLIVGIDLGTTNSLIAQVIDGKPEAIADFDKGVIVPSLVHFGTSGQVEVGEAALPYLLTDPEHTVYSVKRLIGRAHSDVAPEAGFFSYRLVKDEGQVRIQMGSEQFSPVDISAMILRELKARAEHKLKQEIRQAVITVPAYFNDTQRQATRDAGTLAGLEVLRIVNEPTAAALAYGIGLQPDEQQTVVVYDLGGGTFDLTILRIESGIFEVLATHGDTYLGGDDMDRLIVQHWQAEHNLADAVVAADKALGQTLRLLAETAKRTLTEATIYRGKVEIAGKVHALRLTVDTFNALIEPLVQRTLTSAQLALGDAGLGPQDMSSVILVGGSTRVPLVKQRVAEYFGKPLNDTLNPDEVVALGAAVQADILAGGRKGLLLLDVNPLSLGIETAGGLMDVLISRNSKIPTRAGRQYTTSVDGQVNIKIAVYQGERELVADNRKLAEFDLRGIPSMPAGLAKVEITFLLDADSILNVTARELRSGVSQQIAVRPQYGLTDSEVERMLLESFANAEQDVQQRLLAEVRQAAEQMIYTTGRFVSRNESFFTAAEKAEIARLTDALQTAMTGADRSLLQQTLDALEAYTRPFAERVMDEAVRVAMVGKVV